jgi:type IV secretory pathway VirB6-like protein
MKKIAPFILLFLIAAVAWNVFADMHGVVFNIDGDEVDGPIGVALGLLFAGGGTLLAAGIMVMVGLVLAVVFAGIGIILLSALLFAAVCVMLAISPLLLPLLLPLALLWYMASRARRPRVILEKSA